MGLPIQIAVYTSIMLGYLLLLIMAIRNRVGAGRAQRWLEASLVWAACWTLALALLDLITAGRWWALVWHRSAQVGLVLLALLTAEFADAFVQRNGRHWPRWIVVIGFLLLAVTLDVLPLPIPTLILPVLNLPLGPLERVTWLLALAWIVPTVAAWWTAWMALRHVGGTKHRNRIRYLLASLLSFASGDLLILIGGVPDIQVGLAARLFGFAILTFAILHYDLPDLRRLTMSLLRIVLLSSLTGGLYLLAILAAWLFAGIWRLPPQAVLIPSIVLAVLGAALLDVILSPALRRLFDRTVLGQTYDVQKALRSYGEKINLILDLERLADTTLEWLRETLRVERASFVLFTPHEEGQVALSVLRATLDEPPHPKVFGRDSRFLLHFRNIGRPLSQYDMDMLTWFQAMPQEERAWLKALGADLYIPILLSDNPVALLALGPKTTGQPYHAEDLETLMILSGQTGTALENARLLDDLRAVQGDLNRLNNELSETNRQLKRLDQTKSDFVTIASHELRTPLSQIFGYSDVLSSLKMDELGNPQMVNEFLAGISRGAKRLKRVVDAMVDVSLLETGTLKMHLFKIPMSVVVSNAASTVRDAATQRQQILEIRDLSELPYIEADGARLEQVFVSLLSNAVKFTPDGKRIVVSGRLDPSTPEETFVEVTVADEGIGIDPEQRGLIFEKFYRPENPMLHSTDDTAFKGAGPGLGLAIARGIVEAHGGRIWVESPCRDEENCPGSTFYVRLPLVARLSD